MSLRILVIDDEVDIRRLLQDILHDEGHHVEVAGNGAEARTLQRGSQFDLILLDIWMPDVDGITLLREWSDQDRLRCPVVMMSGHATIEAAVEATRLGAIDFIEKPVSLSKLLKMVEQVQERGRTRVPARAATTRAIAPIGRSRLMQQLREQTLRAATSDAPVMLLGEIGVGRELLASYLHDNSTRARQPFVQLSLASLADDSAARELFGSETGGVTRTGVLDHAQGGTLFIKSLDDATPAVQRLLLAALQTGAYTRVDGQQPVTLDVRLISAASPLLVQRNTLFRADLLHLLSTLTLTVPALRDRTEDVPELLRHFAEQMADAENLPLRRFGLSAQNRLRNYPWPGNVQELRNLVRRLLILGGPEEIRLDEVEKELKATLGNDEPLVKQDLLALPLREAREQFERAYLLQQLSLCNGKVSQLSRRVGMERTHLYRKLRMLGVDVRQLAED